MLSRLRYDLLQRRKRLAQPIEIAAADLAVAVAAVFLPAFTDPDPEPEPVF